MFRLGERISFNEGQADLLEESNPVLKRIAKLINNRKEELVVVSGHTDDRPIHNNRFPSNWELSSARSVAVAKRLIEWGVDPHRVSTESYAEYRPLYENTSEENRQANRRVEISLVRRLRKG